MKLNQMKKLGLLGAAAFALTLTPLAASAQLDKCSKDVTKNATKATADVQKELDKCVEGWIKTEVKGDPSKFAKQAEKCEKSLTKIGLGADISADLKSKLGKAFDKVRGALPGGAKVKCTDADLVTLGILPTSLHAGGDISARLLVAAAFKSAWDVQNAVNGQTSHAFGAASAFTECPTCSALSADPDGAPGNGSTSGPCFAAQCQGPGTNSTQTFQAGSPITLTLTLHGSNPNAYCDLPDVLPGALAIVGGPSKGLSANLTGGIPLGVCLDSTRSTGYLVTDAAANPNLVEVNVSTCADIDTNSGDDCAAFTNCTVNPNLPTGAKNCQDLTTVAAVDGSQVSISAQRITASGTSYSAGPPLLSPCITGQITAPGEAGGSAVTTGTASGSMFDVGPGTFAGTTTFTNGPVTGTPFDVAAAKAGILVGSLVGSVATIQDDPVAAGLVGHALTEVSLSCEAAP